MRRRFVLAIALVSTCLTAGTCEFRASSNTGIDRPPPPDSPQPVQDGLLVLVRVGDSDDASPQATAVASAARAAFSTSVLTSRPPAPDETKERPLHDESGKPAALSERDFAASTSDAEGTPIASAVPEPGAILLFGTGLLAAAWRMRSRASRSPRD